MLTMTELASLYERTIDERVLSAYLPGPPHDPAMSDEAITLFHRGISRLRHALEHAPHAEREAFADAAQRALEAVIRIAPGPHGAGVVVFATAKAVLHAGRLQAPPPVSVEWRDGILVSPCMRSLKQHRPAIVVITDVKSSRLLRFRDGILEPVDELASDFRDEPIEHMGDTAPPPFHPGTRGATATDESRRRENAAVERLVRRVAARAEELASNDAWLIVGGSPRGVRELLAALPKGLAARTQAVSGLPAQSTPAEVAESVARAVSELTRHRDSAMVELLIDRAASGGRAATGIDETRRALEARAARELVLSPRLLETSPACAEQLVRAAMEGGSAIEVAAGEGAARLDAECEGVAAELRYPLVSGGTSRDGGLAVA